MEEDVKVAILKYGLLIGLLLFVMIFFGLVRFDSAFRGLWNKNEAELHEIDDATRYDTKKKVEDTCRAMISSYKSDKLVYEQYKSSSSSEKQGWAEQAKIRANKTAISYNEYVLKNEHVWVGNIPSDINKELEVIE